MTPESALIVPVPEAEPVVKNLRARFDPAAPAGVPAHITLLYPFIVPDALDESILAELEAIFSGVVAFPFNLSTTALFPEVFYLVPDPADPFSRLTAAIATRWPETPPYGGIYAETVPHLTVAQTSDDSIVDTIQRKIEPVLPLACRAREAWLMVNREDLFGLVTCSSKPGRFNSTCSGSMPLSARFSRSSWLSLMLRRSFSVSRTSAFLLSSSILVSSLTRTSIHYHSERTWIDLSREIFV